MLFGRFVTLAALLCLSVAAQAMLQGRSYPPIIEMSEAGWQCLVEVARQRQNETESPVIFTIGPKECQPKKAPGRRLPRVDPNLKPGLTILTLAHVRCVAERGSKVRPSAERKVVVNLSKLCA